MLKQKQVDMSNWPVVDSPELPETYCDQFLGMMFDGRALKILLGTARPTPARNPTDNGTTRVTARLVLSPDLAHKLTESLAVLSKSLADAAKPKPKDVN